MGIMLYAASNDHLETLRSRGYAPKSILQYKTTYNHAINRWGSIDVRDIGPAEIDAFFARQPWSVRTYNRHLTRLRGFFAYARMRQWIGPDVDPTAGWDTRREHPVRERTWLTVDEMLTVRQAALDLCERDAALFDVAMFTFLRAGEIVTLTVGDLDLQAHTLRVYRHKTKQADVLPVCAELADAMRWWLAIYEESAGPLQPEWLLVPARGPLPAPKKDGSRLPRPLRPTRQVSHPGDIVRRAMVTAGWDTLGDGGHVLRRSGALELFRRLRADGHDGALRRVSSMLGHGSTKQTEHYLSINSERAERNLLLGGLPMFTTTEQRAA